MKAFDFLIIGAGPTGLGAACRLKKYGVSSFSILEAGEKVGGLSASFKDAFGFSWDVGGHVLFSRNDTFIRLMDDLMGTDLLCHSRRARVRIKDGWTDYPFQDHIHQLDEELARKCRDGLNNAPGPGDETHTFADWIRHSFGDGIAELFMEPYNHKVWTYPLHLMGTGWVHERISTAQEKTVGTNGGWGANRSFRYPATGGNGEIFNRLAKRVDGHILFRHEAVTIDLERKVVTTGSGDKIEYKALLSTVPLKHLVRKMLTTVREEIVAAAERLVHNSVTVAGIGVDAPGDQNTSWMYFPEPGCPFYRLTHLHNYSPAITPESAQSALMVEIATPADQGPKAGEVVSQVISCLIKTGQLKEEDRHRVVSTWEYCAPHGYPIPTIGRDQALDVILPFLENHAVYSRGRFGGWRYEIGNMDHSVIQGIEWADRMIKGEREQLINTRY
jgi:protoporphyrinogen oxidase